MAMSSLLPMPGCGSIRRMSMTITMDPERWLSQPAVFRDKLSVMRGTKFKADLTGTKIELTPETGDNIHLVNKRGLMVITGIKGPVDAVAAIQADRLAREARLVSIDSRP